MLAQNHTSQKIGQHPTINAVPQCICADPSDPASTWSLSKLHVASPHASTIAGRCSARRHGNRRLVGSAVANQQQFRAVSSTLRLINSRLSSSYRLRLIQIGCGSYKRACSFAHCVVVKCRMHHYIGFVIIRLQHARSSDVTCQRISYCQFFVFSAALATHAHRLIGIRTSSHNLFSHCTAAFIIDQPRVIFKLAALSRLKDSSEMPINALLLYTEMRKDTTTYFSVYYLSTTHDCDTSNKPK